MITDKPSASPAVLSIAGHDPSAGAGLLADIRTFAEHDVNAIGVCTAITVQNENEFREVHWTQYQLIEKQLECALVECTPSAIKIGLIESTAVLEQLVCLLRSVAPNAFIVWDPILRASAGYEFHTGAIDLEPEILAQLNLITPNLEEATPLGINTDPYLFSQKCPVIVKGGHAKGDRAEDVLYVAGEAHYFSAARLSIAARHGSGCVFSAAILANVAHGLALPQACKKAKEYTLAYLANVKFDL